ncbi:helix-turn-helix domain-containing protein [Bradyrhizobium sp. KB893862 SZCCT0404]|uniref:helix-turn-helix domain-containing protein n=1 Tax=Bradyrhizobium sp. KB893862 SZCCT0404 TaxID=2807672 RepID=UPI001BA74F0B|nr:helix-turn-helix domain-containing protein [Bradyrhizobium sp. KB893862 SZCCT0404]
MRRGVAGPGPVAASGAAPVGAELIASHYVARRWMLTSKAARPFIHLLCLHSASTAEVCQPGKTTTFTGPVIVWLPAGSAEWLEVSAGARAELLQLRAGVWHRYLPPSAETAYLALEAAGGIMARPVAPDLVTTMSRSIAAIAAEIASPARSGAASILSAELTLCVLRFWRLFAGDTDRDEEGSSTEILSRFRRLLEERYHQHLRVGDYAGLLGMTPDRLHALCSRELKRSPSELIQQRVVKEAASRLEAGTVAVKQIAFALGFKDTAYFNRFFRKHTGEAPGVWRRRVAARVRAGRSPPTLNFADWP